MTGQDAVNVASTFNEKIGIDGVILTKLDGDTRIGAALSIKAVTGVRSICWYGREAFGSGTVSSGIVWHHVYWEWVMWLTLIEKAEAEIDQIKPKRWRKNSVKRNLISMISWIS